MQVLTLVTPIVKALGHRADPALLKELPLATGTVFLLYIAYLAFVIFGDAAPGNSAFNTSPESIQAIVNESVNFFYVVPFLNLIGVPLIPKLVGNPVDEAIFNIIGAWGLMFLPLMLADKSTNRMKDSTKWGLWVGTWVSGCYAVDFPSILVTSKQLWTRKGCRIVGELCSQHRLLDCLQKTSNSGALGLVDFCYASRSS